MRLPDQEENFSVLGDLWKPWGDDSDFGGDALQHFLGNFLIKILLKNRKQEHPHITWLCPEAKRF